MPVEVQTLFGTRVILLSGGGRITITKDESELVKLRVYTFEEGVSVVELQLTQSDCLGLIEFLAVAAQPHSGKPMFDVLAEDASEAKS